MCDFPQLLGDHRSNSIICIKKYSGLLAVLYSPTDNMAMQNIDDLMTVITYFQLRRNISVYLLHTYIQTWIPKYVTNTIGCGTSHKYTNIHNFYGVKYYKHFTKQ